MASDFFFYSAVAPSGGPGNGKSSVPLRKSGGGSVGYGLRIFAFRRVKIPTAAFVADKYLALLPLQQFFPPVSSPVSHTLQLRHDCC